MPCAISSLEPIERALADREQARDELPESRLANEKALAIGLTLLIAAGAGAFLWWDANKQPAATLAPHVQPAQPPARPFAQTPAPPPKATRPAPEANALFRCEHRGTVTYQSSPCLSGARQAQVDRGTMSVVSPPPIAKSAPAPAPLAQAEGGKVGFVSRTPSFGSGNVAQCAGLEKEVARIDAAARRGLSAQQQERLKTRRKEVKDEMWGLECGF